MRHFKQAIGFLLISILLLHIRCDTTDCITFSTNAFIIQFFDKDSGQPESIDFQTIEAFESKIVLYADTSLNTFYLPVNTAMGSTTFILKDASNQVDSLTVGYTKTEKLISEECGFELTFSNLLVLRTSYDSVVVSLNELSRLNEENIQIYR